MVSLLRFDSMGTLKFIVLLIFYCVCFTFEYPSRPLNERSPDLTWQAWLLVDDQNQNQNKQYNADGMLRRRITPKSVFIAPTFSPESLPACADGYSSDPMGRCIKIIKLDQDAHYEFLIEKLKQKFETFDYEEEEEEEDEIIQPTAGPFQVNIPLNIDGDDLRPEESDQETDVAIIVSPTKPDFDFKIGNLGKRDSLADEIQQEMLLKKLAEPTTTKMNSELPTTTFLTTTLQDETKTTMSDNELTTPEEALVENTVVTTTGEVEGSTRNSKVTTEIAETTTEEFTTLLTTTESSIVTQSPKPFDEEVYELKSQNSEVTTVSPKPDPVATTNFVQFPNELKSQTLLNSFVRFPQDSDVNYQTQLPSSVEHITNVRDASVFQKKTDRPVVFPEQDVVSLDYSNGVHSQVDLNRRNRDRHNSLFLIPPRRNPSNFQKPLVLRFSRKHAFMDTDQFKNADYYRSIPSDDFAYLFKYKHRQQVHRR